MGVRNVVSNIKVKGEQGAEEDMWGFKREN
jgi:hypothetical protein